MQGIDRQHNIYKLTTLSFRSRAILVDLNVYRIRAEEPPDRDMLLLAITSEAANSLRLTCFVYLLSWCEKG